MDIVSAHELGENDPRFHPHLPCCSTDGQPCLPCVKILELGSEMEEARKRYQGMVSRHQQMKAIVNSAHNPITSRFPTEVISHIFYLSLDLVPFSDHSLGDLPVPGDFDVAAPLKLGAVCSLWRKMAWSTPQLWKFISVHLNASKFPTRGDTASQWLKRSGNLPLFIHLYASARKAGDVLHERLVHNFIPLIKDVNACSDRWQIVDFDLPLCVINRIEYHSSISPALLVLEITTGRDNMVVPHDRRSFSAPNLNPTQLALWNFPLRSMKIGWTRLTKLDSESMRVDELLKIFAKAPLLSFCDATGIHLSKQASNTYPPIPLRHPALVHLRLDGSWKDLSDFFKRVNFPSLQRLHISSTEVTPMALSLPSIIKRFGCHSTDLTLELLRSASLR